MTHPTDALRLVPHEKVRELAMQLARSIAGLGYPVGLGVAPPEDVCMKAAQGIFDLYLTAAPASPLPGGGDWIDGTPEVPVGTPTWCGWASYEIRRLRSELPAAPTGEPK